MIKIFIFVCLFSLAYSSDAQSKYRDSLKIVLTNTAKPVDRFNLLVKIGEDIYKNGDGNVDSLTCIQLLQIAQQLNSDSLLAISYNWIGNYFRSNKGDNTMALEYLFKGVPLAEKAKDKRRISSLNIDISLSYFNLYNPAEAIKFIRKAGANLPDHSSPMYDFMAGQYQFLIAHYFVLQQQPDSALHFVQALNETNLRLKSIIFESMAKNLSGAVYELLGDKTLAEIYYQKANFLADSSRFYDGRLITKTDYTGFLLRNNKIHEAKEQARQLFELGGQINNNNMKLAGAGFLRQAFDDLHLTDSAYYYSRLESALKDSIFSQNNINKVQALAFNEQIRIMEKTIKDLAEAEQRRENIQYVAIATGIVIFIILYLLLSRSFITSSKIIEFLGVIALLIVFEFLNLLLHPFLEKMTNHSPLLILLALVCIAAMLVPFHHKAEKWATTKLVGKNKQIRLAIARRTIEKLEGVKGA